MVSVKMVFAFSSILFVINGAGSSLLEMIQYLIAWIQVVLVVSLEELQLYPSSWYQGVNHQVKLENYRYAFSWNMERKSNQLSNIQNGKIVLWNAII